MAVTIRPYPCLCGASYIRITADGASCLGCGHVIYTNDHKKGGPMPSEQESSRS